MLGKSILSIVLSFSMLLTPLPRGGMGIASTAGAASAETAGALLTDGAVALPDGTNEANNPAPDETPVPGGEGTDGAAPEGAGGGDVVSPDSAAEGSISYEPMAAGVPAAQSGEATVYIDENFDSYTAEKIIASNQNTTTVPTPVTKGSITYKAGTASNRAVDSSASIVELNGGKGLELAATNYATAGRGVWFTFEYTGSQPDLSSLQSSGLVLELSMDVTSNQSFVVASSIPADQSKADRFAVIPSTEGAAQKARVIIDTEHTSRYLIITDADGELISSDIAACEMSSGTGFAGATFFEAMSYNIKLDNIRIESKTADVSLVTVNVKQTNGTALEGATVTVGSLTADTDADGNAQFALPFGTYTVSTSKAGLETGDNSSKSVTVNSAEQAVNLELVTAQYTPEPTTVTVGGGQGVIIAAKGEEAATSTAFTVSVKDQMDADMATGDYTTEWSIYPEGTTNAAAGVSIADGVVSVTSEFETENKVAKFDVIAKVTANGKSAEGKATVEIANSNVVYYESLNWSIPASTRNQSKNLSQEVTLPKLANVTLNIEYASGPDGSTGNTKETGQSTLALVSNGGKMAGVQYQRDSTKDVYEIYGWVGQGTLTSNLNQSADKGAYAAGEKLMDADGGATSLKVTFTIDQDKNTVTISNGTTTLDALELQVAAATLKAIQYGLYRSANATVVKDILITEAEEAPPVEPDPDAQPYVVLTATGNSTTINPAALITGANISGYQITTAKDGKKVSQEIVKTLPTSVDTTGADQVEIAAVYTYAGKKGSTSFTFDLAEGNYDFIVWNSSAGKRCDVYLNDQMLLNNMFQYGNSPDHMRVNDIVHKGSTAKIEIMEFGSGSSDKYEADMIKVDVVKVPDIVDRVPKMFVLGDSLVAIYYNGGSPENTGAQTGWGQVLSEYLNDEIEVVDLANSGVTAIGLESTAFSRIRASAQSGDIFVLESGYNDANSKNEGYDAEGVNMKAAVTTMVTEAKALGMEVILVSPNASAHDYKDPVAWADKMEEVATAQGVKFLDLSELSYNFLLETYGENDPADNAVRLTVSKIYNVEEELKGLHSNFNAAHKWASLVAQELKDSLGHADLVDTDYLYWFDDGEGNVITCSAVKGKEVEGVVTVTYDLQGHGAAISPKKVQSGSKLKEPTVSKVYGYTFGGWYTDQACTKAWNFESDTVAGEMTLYAKWTEKEGSTIPEESVLFFEDFEGRKAPDEVNASSTNAPDKLTIKAEDDHFGDVLSYDFTGASDNSRGAVMKFVFEDAAEIEALKQYVVEFDACIKPGNDQDTHLSVMGSDAAYAINDGMTGGYLIDLRNKGKSGTEYNLNGISEPVYTIPSGVWCHYTLYVDKEKGASGMVATTITRLDMDTDPIADKVHVAYNGNGTVGGIYMRAGRTGAVLKINDVMVRNVIDTDDFGELGEEAISKVEFASQLNQVIKQPAADAPVHLPIALKVTGNQGGDLSGKVTVKWTVIGTEGDDGYLSLTKTEGTGDGTSGAEPDGATAYFNVRNGVSNYIGYVKAEVTYGGKSKEVMTPFVIQAANSANANRLAPDAGYPVNMNDYADSLVGYVGTADTQTGRDVVLNNWSMYGSNGSRAFKLAKDADGTKYLEFTAPAASAVPTYQWVDQTEQYVIDFTARFNSGMNFGVYANTPNNGKNDPEWYASYANGELKLNGGNKAITGIDAKEWYRFVVSADPSVNLASIIVYDKAGKEVGKLEDVEMLNENSTQKYFCFLGTFPLALNLQSFQAYKPVVGTITVGSAEDVARVPAEGAAAVTVDFSASLTSTEGLKMTGPVTWELADEYANVELESTGAQTAQLKISAGASGAVTVAATKDGKRAEKTIQLTTSTNTVSFTQSTSSITIPFAGEEPAVATYTARTIDKDGNEIDGGAITYSLLAKDGVTEASVSGVTFENGVLTVAPGASPAVVWVRATNGEGLSNRVKVNIHGLSFAFGSADAAEGFTQVTDNTYNDRLGYGFQDVSGLTVNADNVTGTAAYTFKAKVPNGNYTVTVDTTAETITSEVVEGVPSPTGIVRTGATFRVAVCDGILDLTFPAGASVKAIEIFQDAAQGRRAKPAVFVIGDSTAKNTANGAMSWGNCVEGGKVELPDVFSGFENHGHGGKNSVSYYNEGSVEGVLLSIRPGDFVTVNMGINGDNTINEGGSYPTLLSEYYVEGILQRGGIPVIVTATPDGPVYDGRDSVADHEYYIKLNYDAVNQRFTNDRGDGARNDVLRRIAEEKGLKVIEVGKAGMDWMNTFTMDDVTAYNAENGTNFQTVLEMVQSWYVDHNHYKEPIGVWVGNYILGQLADMAPGAVMMEPVEKDEKAPETIITTDADTIAAILTNTDPGKQVLTSEQLQKIEDGANAKVTMKIEDAADKVTESQQTQIKNAVPGYEVGTYVDITLKVKFEKRDGTSLGEDPLTDLKGAELEIQIKVPESLINTDENVTREYVIVREHNGEYDILTPVYDPETKTLTFRSGKFSTYAIAYKDRDTTENPTDPSNPVDPSDPTKPVDPSDPTKPVDPSDPTKPVDPSDPTKPVDPTSPTDPSNSEDSDSDEDDEEDGRDVVTTAVQTGDYMNGTVWFIVLAAAVAGMGTIVVRRNRRKSE